MTTSFAELECWLKKPEDINLEFKLAQNSFSRDKDLPDYCAALANEKGGKLILGVDNNGIILGTRAFDGTHTTLSHKLMNDIHIRVDVEEIMHPRGRVLVFHVPSRHVGTLISSTGDYRFPMRAGESLIEMDPQTIKRILNEAEPDFSAQIIPGLTMSDMDGDAISHFRARWAAEAERPEYAAYSMEKTLRAAGVMSDEGLNRAALVLFGKKEKIDRLLPDSEIIYEWRQSSGKTAYDFRKTWREPFFKIYDEVWETINARNARNPFVDGLFRREIAAYSEKPIREALLNAVAHRDYSVAGRSIFVRTSPESFLVESPGGFPDGVNIENILQRSVWRNRCIADVFEKAGLVERSGQGMNDIFKMTISEGKGLPDLSRSDKHTVVLVIPAQVKDPAFILFLEKVARERNIQLSDDEIFALERIRESNQFGALDRSIRKKLLEAGLVEKVGTTRDAQYILSHLFYTRRNETGVYTRLRGLDRAVKKELILKHITLNGKGYAEEFEKVFPELSKNVVSNMLTELKKKGKIRHKGARRTGYWELME